MNDSTEVRITAAEGEYLSADHRVARTDDLTGPLGRPCVVMAHGLGGTRDSGLAEFAEAFCAAGADVLTFDYRHFAESSGSPRQLVSLSRQLADYRYAIAYARGFPGVDPARVVVWGVSLSGGHVIRLAAADATIAGVISLTPAVDGAAALAQMLRAQGPVHVLRLVRAGLLDAATTWSNRLPVLIPIVGQPGDAAMLCSPGAMDGMLTTAGPSWRNAIAARIALAVGKYRPATLAHEVSCPVLMQIADDDQSAPAGAATRAATRMRATVHHYPCDHFDVYSGASYHDLVVRHQVSFLRRLMASKTEATSS